MIKRFIRKNKDNFFGGEIVGEISDKELIKGLLLLKKEDYKIDVMNINEFNDVCIVIIDNNKKEVRFLKKCYTVEIKYNKIFENIQQAEEYRKKYGGTLRCFTNELRDKRDERIDNNYDFTTYL